MGADSTDRQPLIRRCCVFDGCGMDDPPAGGIVAAGIGMEAAMGSILVVDDHVDTNEILCRLLRSLGHRTASAFTGDGALAALASDRPDLVILDMMMPGMDGFEVLRQVRAAPATAKLPVILYSGIAEPDFQACAIQRGANAYWVKGGMDFSRLAEMIAQYV